MNPGAATLRAATLQPSTIRTSESAVTTSLPPSAADSTLRPAAIESAESTLRPAAAAAATAAAPGGGDPPPTYHFPVRRLALAIVLVVVGVGMAVAAAVGRDVILAGISAAVFAAGAYALYALVQVRRGHPSFSREAYYDIEEAA